MRKIAANLIFPCDGKIIKFGHVIVDDDGTIVDVVDTGGKLVEEEGLEYHNGVLVPGFLVDGTNASTSEKDLRIRTISGVQKEIVDVKNIEYNTKEPVVNQMFNEQLDNMTFSDALYKATIEPATVIGEAETLGCFKKGAKPGVVLLYPFDFVNEKMRHDTLSKRLV